MKKVIAIAVAFAALGSAQVFAQAKNFEGFSVGANLEADHGTQSATDTSTGSDHSYGLGLQGRYDWAMSDQFLLGLGVNASTGKRNVGSYASGTNGYTKNNYSIDLMPGYALSNNLLVYGKVSALTATALSDDGSNTASVHGTGYGIGVRGLLDKNAFWQVGLDTRRFNDVTFNTGTTASLKNNDFSVGVGYKF